ncbi:MAG: hypothetical protein V1766_09360 [Pseudomonadota bacterium]
MSCIKVNIGCHRDKTGTYVCSGSQQFTPIKNLNDAPDGRCTQLLNLSQFANDLGVSVKDRQGWLSIQAIIPIEFKLDKTPNLTVASNISRFKKLFSRFMIRRGRVVSHADQTMTRSSNITAIILDG